MRRVNRGLIALMAAAVALLAGQATIGVAQGASDRQCQSRRPETPTPTSSHSEGPMSGLQMGFVYQNVPAFNLKTGDTIAFDLGAQNNVDIQLQISMAATTVNGGDIPGPYTTVVNNTQVPLNPRGNT